VFNRIKRRENLSAHIAHELHRAIVNGSMKPGDHLPGQRELATQFGASVATIREAISILTAAGVLDVSPGRGTIIQGISDSEPTFDGWLGLVLTNSELLEMLETRAVIEAFMVRRAATESTTQQIDQLPASLAALEAQIDDLESYYDADIAFHQTIAEIAGNRVLSRLMKAIQTSMIGQLRESHATSMSERQRIVATYHTHAQMVEAIADHDAERALVYHSQMIDRAKALIAGQVEPNANSD